MKSFFPDMLQPSGSELSLELIAGKFDYFFQQLHLLHLQTSSFAEHKALQVWDTLPDSKDEFLEKLMGYEGRRIKSYKTGVIQDYSVGIPEKIVMELKDFASQLESYASMKGYSDIENMAQSLSGTASSTLYLLTLS